MAVVRSALTRAEALVRTLEALFDKLDNMTDEQFDSLSSQELLDLVSEVDAAYDLLEEEQP